LRLQITVKTVNTKTVKASSPLRFRRWSRAGYAIFCSLACAVTIGCIAVSISDKSLQKGVAVSISSTSSLDSDAESKNRLSELLELEVTIQKNQEITLVENQSVSAAACQQVFNIYFIHQNG